jgi:hypothetical protein
LLGARNPFPPVVYPASDSLGKWTPGSSFQNPASAPPSTAARSAPARKKRRVESPPAIAGVATAAPLSQESTDPRSEAQHRESVFLRAPPNTAMPDDDGGIASEQHLERMRMAFDDDIADLVPLCQVHAHYPGCMRWVQGDMVCRFRFPKTAVESSYADQSGVHHFKRDHNWVSNYNQVLTVALRCNTDVSLILNGGEANSIAFYITDYITKKVSSMLSFCPLGLIPHGH